MAERSTHQAEGDGGGKAPKKSGATKAKSVDASKRSAGVSSGKAKASASEKPGIDSGRPKAASSKSSDTSPTSDAQPAITTPIDPKAWKILEGTFWDGKGWIEQSFDEMMDDEGSLVRKIPKKDFEYAKQAGLMFDLERSMPHDKLVDRVRKSVERVDARRVADAFVVGLSTGRPDLCSALGSYAIARHLPVHPRQEGHNSGCVVCGAYDKSGEDEEDPNVLNFERIKFGGVRHADLLYEAIDLEIFSGLTVALPSEADVKVLRDMFRTLATAPASTNATSATKLLRSVIQGDQSARTHVIETLGYCGILCTSQYLGYLGAYIPYSERRDTNNENDEWSYPVSHWRVRDGVNQQAVDFWFGHLLKAQ